MAKKKAQPKAVLKVEVIGGQATPAPPLGPALSQHKINIGQFISMVNEKTSDQMGVPLPVVVRIYPNGSFDFDVRTPPASYLLKQAAQAAKGSGMSGRESVGSVTRAQVRDIAAKKQEDLNAKDLDAAEKVIAGTARSCGIDVVD